VSETDKLSSNNASQSIFDTAHIADGFMSINHLYVEIQPHLDNDLDNILLDVFFHM
jgi:hypothetical protein